MKAQTERQDLEVSHQRLVGTIEKFIKRLETAESARDAQFERLVKWAKEVSEKTGIPMPQL
jgi:hypothetical protein